MRSWNSPSGPSVPRRPHQSLRPWSLDNHRVVCMRCNEIKGGLTEAEFASLLALLANWPEETCRATLARLRAGGTVGR